MERMYIGKIKDCPIKGFKPIQINNLTIKWDKLNGKFSVTSPNKTILEEFTSLSSARKWAKETKDFVRR